MQLQFIPCSRFLSQQDKIQRVLFVFEFLFGIVGLLREPPSLPSTPRVQILGLERVLCS